MGYFIINFGRVGTLSVRKASELSRSITEVGGPDDNSVINLMPSIYIMLDGDCFSGLGQ